MPPRRHSTSRAALATVLAATIAPAPWPWHHPTPVAEVIVFNDNGGWSWFEDERAVIDCGTGTLLVSSVANSAGSGGRSRDGNVEVVAHDLRSGATRRTVLHANLQADDHDSAALFVRADGRYLAVYSRHHTDTRTRWRVSDGSGITTGWKPAQTFDHDAPTTYSNLYPSGDGNRLYLFVRTVERDPHFLVSDDDGSTWAFGGRLLDGPGRPYVRYAADGVGRIHLITTEQHPLDFANSVYHGVIDDGRLLGSDGMIVDSNLSDRVAVSPSGLTRVFAGDDQQRAWTVDVAIDDDGLPNAVFSLRTTFGHRYDYAHFDGTRWETHPVADAGRALYPAEPDYTGLAALDPNDPSRLIISTDTHPATGRPLISRRDGHRHYELFEGNTVDHGATWSWTTITTNSTVDNIRPIIPSGDCRQTVLLWLRGTYTNYKDYDLDVVGLLEAGRQHDGPSPHDASLGGDNSARDTGDWLSGHPVPCNRTRRGGAAARGIAIQPRSWS